MKKDKFVKQPKTRLLHVYVSSTTYDKLIEYQNKYHLSISAMCTIALEKWNLLTLSDYFKENYIDPNRNSKTDTRTCIKSKYFRDNPLDTRLKETILATNVLYLLANELKSDKIWAKSKYNILNGKYEEPEETKQARIKILNQIKNEFLKQKDLYWNFNQQYRCNVRARKQLNKEYPTT